VTLWVEVVSAETELPLVSLDPEVPLESLEPEVPLESLEPGVPLESLEPEVPLESVGSGLSKGSTTPSVTSVSACVENMGASGVMARMWSLRASATRARPEMREETPEIERNLCLTVPPLSRTFHARLLLE
jgi:hypothetical protein